MSKGERKRTSKRDVEMKRMIFNPGTPTPMYDM